jgi:hypothetical protein
MLTKEKIKEMADYLHVSAEELTTAISEQNEVDIAIPDLSVYTNEELSTLKKNIEDQHYKNGFNAGSEVLVKDAKKKYGVESEGRDMDLFLEGYKKKVIEETKTEPNKKIQELESSNASLKATMARLEDEKSDLEKTHRKWKVQSNALNSIQKEYNLSKSDMMALMVSSGYEIDEDENGRVITKKQGNTVRDQKTQDPLSFDVVFEEFAKEKGQIKTETTTPPSPPRGRGGTSSKNPPAAYSSLKEMEADWKAQGKSTLGEEFMAKAQECSKNNPDFFK